MAIVEMVMPKMGESIMEGTVLSWLKQEGDTIEADESVLKKQKALRTTEQIMPI